MNELALFAGAGGGILGGRLLGWRTICAVESDPYCCKVLAQRQDDGVLDPFPIWNGDIRDFDGRPWRGVTDVVTGGFPCTDISLAGKGAGIRGPESGTWVEMARLLREIRPRYVLVENSPMLTSRGLGVVLGDLASLGFNAEWGVLGANASPIGAPQKRDRIWILAMADPHDRDGESIGSPRRVGRGLGASETLCPDLARGVDWPDEPDVGRVAPGVASRVDRLRALGNGQVPAVVRLALLILGERIQ